MNPFHCHLKSHCIYSLRNSRYNAN